jgi:hypothetical protein
MFQPHYTALGRRNVVRQLPLKSAPWYSAMQIPPLSHSWRLCEARHPS